MRKSSSGGAFEHHSFADQTPVPSDYSETEPELMRQWECRRKGAGADTDESRMQVLVQCGVITML